MELREEMVSGPSRGMGGFLQLQVTQAQVEMFPAPREVWVGSYCYANNVRQPIQSVSVPPRGLGRVLP